MADQIIEIGNGFWNIRGSFRIAGLLDIGTQASLVQLKTGRFVLLDAYTLKGSVKQKVDELTDGGSLVDAIVNLHPFHTVHVEKAHQQYPKAKLYGTPRHLERFRNLPWAPEGTQSPALHEKYGEDFEFSVPEGVDFISSDDKVHFSSVLVWHPASRTIHSDDTLMYLQLPGLARAVGLGDSVSFHPTLAQALERRPGASEDFRHWAQDLIKRWCKAENLCAAHTGALLAENNNGASLKERMLTALEKVGKTLEKHQRDYG